MIYVPISLGELIDKITILKIKKSKITDSKKLSNVIKEYDLLLNIMHNYMTEENELFIQLYHLNLEFWDYHDWQREKWKQLKDMPTTMIDYELYKKNEDEHKMNDKRAEIKKQINILYSSEIVEEKQFKSYDI